MQDNDFSASMATGRCTGLGDFKYRCSGKRVVAFARDTRKSTTWDNGQLDFDAVQHVVKHYSAAEGIRCFLYHRSIQVFWAPLLRRLRI